ncbi:MAG: hypothetical protein GWP70_10730 [Proteobacteria bacterium]|nr:hypothetical protein [Pseudomonadota bacterium]
MNPRRRRISSWVLLLLVWGVSPVWPDAASVFGGRWVVNAVESDLLREDLDARTTLIQNPGRMSASVMGIPLPGGGSASSRSHSQLSARDPAVLRSEIMHIDVGTKEVRLSFPGLSGPEALEVMVKGDFRGRKTSWSRSKIQQKYKTTERKVQKHWSIRADGRLLVVVEIKPKGGKKRTLSRVFDRA